MLHLDLTIGARGFQDLRSPSPIMAPGIKHDLEGKWTMKMKSKRGNPQYRPYSRKKSLSSYLWSLSVSEIPGLKVANPT